MHILKQI